MPRRNETLEELLARTTDISNLAVPTTSKRVSDAQAQLEASRRELMRRGVQPAQRIASEQAEDRPPPSWPYRAGGAIRRGVGHAVDYGGRVMRATSTPEGWLQANMASIDRSFPHVPVIENFVRGVAGASPRERTPWPWVDQTPPTPAAPPTPTSASATTTARTARTAPANTPEPVAEPVVEPPRQTSFTNADAEGLAERVMTMPAVEVPQQPSAIEQALMAAIERMAPPREQATLIRHTPERRPARNAVERRAQLREADQDIARAQLDRAGQAEEQSRRQQALQEQATLLATMSGQEQALQSQLMMLSARANQLTPEGRLAAARAAQIEEAITRIRAARAAGELTLEQEIAFLMGSQDERQPIQDAMGGVQGTYSSTTGAPSLFPEEIRAQLNPTLRR